MVSRSALEMHFRHLNILIIESMHKFLSSFDPVHRIGDCEMKRKKRKITRARNFIDTFGHSLATLSATEITRCAGATIFYQFSNKF